MGKPFGELSTPGGHLCGEAASALQKSIRRGLETDALYWATELDLAGFGNYAWKRLRIIASEDVGLADTQAVIASRALYENWVDARKSKDDMSGQDQLYLCHAVLVLCRAQKSRIVDHALMVFYEGDRSALGIDVPDYALDQHTRRGKQMGRGLDHFFEVGSQITNKADLDDPFAAEGRKARKLAVARKQEARGASAAAKPRTTTSGATPPRTLRSR